MNHVASGDAGVGVGMPWAGIAENNRRRRQCLEVFLVHEFKLVRIAGLCAKSDAERVEHSVALGQFLLDLGDVPVDELVVIDRHDSVLRQCR
jgi:hypothetical protein